MECLGTGCVEGLCELLLEIFVVVVAVVVVVVVCVCVAGTNRIFGIWFLTTETYFNGIEIFNENVVVPDVGAGRTNVLL